MLTIKNIKDIMKDNSIEWIEDPEYVEEGEEEVGSDGEGRGNNL